MGHLSIGEAPRGTALPTIPRRMRRVRVPAATRLAHPGEKKSLAQGLAPLTTKSASRSPHSAQRCLVALLVRRSYQTMNRGDEFARTHRLHQNLVPVPGLGRQLEYIAAQNRGSCSHVGGAIDDLQAVAIGQAKIRVDQRISQAPEALTSLRHRGSGIDDIAFASQYQRQYL